MEPYVFAGGTAVITGAASGIGEALSHRLAARSSALELVDRDGHRLAAVAAAVRGAHPSLAVATHVADLADAGAVRELAATLRGSRVSLLVNNAGVALAGRFDQVSLDDFEWVVDVNFRAVVRLTHALLPALKERPGSHVVNLSSVFGIVAPPGQAAYAASKFAVRGFTEALRAELVDDGIGVTSVHPGGIRTRIAQNARVGGGVPAVEAGMRDHWERVLTMDPARAAGIILTAVEQRRPRALVGRDAAALDLLARLLPSAYNRVIAAAAARAGRRAEQTAG